MPELPEVEHAARTLRRWISKTKEITAVRAPASRVLAESDRRALKARLPGHRLRSIERRGKWLLLAFDGDVGVIAHLGMTGKWQRGREGAPGPRNVRLALELAGGEIVYYTDPRMFGRIRVIPAARLREAVADLGPDPLADGIDVGALHERLSRTSRPLKVALVDQTVLAGLGNIQATEALWRARLDPWRPARALSRGDVARLARAIQGSLEHTLRAQGRGDRITYVEEGGDNPFLIYARAGERCPRCRATIEARTLGGRTTAFCPRCQRPKTTKGAAGRTRRPPARAAR